jgi:serine/threonine-protein phosphatase 2A regulatory subunit B
LTDKTVKLWKFGPRRRYASRAVHNFVASGKLTLPIEDYSLSPEDYATIGSSSKRTYANAHAYHINSLSLNSDQETFVSADDLRINMWKLDSNDTTFSE